MNGIVLTHELETSVIQALTQLLEQDTARQTARTQQREALEKFRPLIISLRAKNRSWTKIAATLRAGGITVSKTTLQRIFEPGKTTAKKTTGNSTKKARNKSAKKSAVNAEINLADSQPNNAPEWYTTVAPPKTEEMCTVNAPEIHETIHSEFPADDYLGLERVIAATGGTNTVWAKHVRAAQADADHPLRRQFVREAIVSEIPSPDPEIVENVIPKKASPIFGAALDYQDA